MRPLATSAWGVWRDWKGCHALRGGKWNLDALFHPHFLLIYDVSLLHQLLSQYLYFRTTFCVSICTLYESRKKFWVLAQFQCRTSPYSWRRNLRRPCSWTVCIVVLKSVVKLLVNSFSVESLNFHEDEIFAVHVVELYIHIMYCIYVQYISKVGLFIICISTSLLHY